MTFRDRYLAVAIATLFSFSARSQSATQYVPANPETIKLTFNVNNQVRWDYVGDLVRLRVSLAKHSTDSSAMMALINARVKYSDTAGMLSGYARAGVSYTKAQADARFAPLSHLHTASDITNFNSAVDARIPSAETGASIKTKLEGLTGTNRLDASAIQNLPSGGTATTDASLLTSGTLSNARLEDGVRQKHPDYTIGKSGSNYYAFDNTGNTAFTGTNAATVINSAIFSLANGGTISFTRADYNLSYPIIDSGRASINLVFAKGAKLIAGAALNKPVIYLTSTSHWRVYNVEIDGNASNQTAPQVSGAPSIIPDGFGASTCTDVILYDAYIHDVRRFGANFDESSKASGIINSYVTLCG